MVLRSLSEYLSYAQGFLFDAMDYKEKSDLPSSHLLVIPLKPCLVHLKHRWLKCHKDGNHELVQIDLK